ncbi:sulfite reductase subunit alpha [Mycetocola reblochoni]|uniref:assimilatory sulfite reductase (NADPH) n=2 Tax=Mycetocola reblochoni TaxID=331618 RepID=A0A1R4KEF0_9MICO|nr:sulfite reductase subunit alpha [Mycetocola reblochoni]RLP68397.1 sulfite reductase subunit alpha [Mycetocola reblochoni]SJN42494.1 Sulfite reductase [NADPH] flavoprotein alpha-component [Mycetocola reblochoni REB411]
MISASVLESAPFSTEQRAWIAGYLAGLAAGHAASGDTAAPSATTLTLNVLVGTQTGNSEEYAEDLAAAARAQGLAAAVTSLDGVTADTLATLENILVVTSTYGEGEMPDNAELFWESFHAEGAPRLESARFSVLALGDSSYDGYCQAGKLIDTRFEQLGASRIVPRVDVDVDGDDDAAAWIGDVVEAFAALQPASAAAAPVPADAAPTRTRSPWSKKTPYPSRLVANRVLSGPGSAKEIRHYEFDLGDSGIEYHAGDALNVVPSNDPALVDLLLDQLDASGDEEHAGTSLREQLGTALEISAPSKDLIQAIVEADPDSELGRVVRLGDKRDLESWLWGKDSLDLLRLSPSARFDPLEFAGLLRPLQPRAYSISSSPLHSPDRIHLTVASVRYGSADRRYGGVASTHMADRVGDSAIGIYLQPNAAFRVPEDDSAPVIMVGPGTGIAPFRAFLQERQGRGADGRNWLFFGDQHRANDYIYEDELDEFGRSGLLTRLDLAFSRDQAEKIYVQSRMREHGAELYAWLEEGGHFYVCGDASRMARDVDDALHEVIAEHSGLGADAAADYVAALKREKRYVRDVY